VRQLAGSERIKLLRRAALRALASTYNRKRVVLPVRSELPVLLNRRGLTGTGAEIGVAHGSFSEQILDRWRGRVLISVDPWQEFPAEAYADITNQRQPVQDNVYEVARNRLATFGSRSDIWRTTSLQAAERISPGALDFVYIDARHDYTSVLEDITAWYPKVRRGGVMAGHDYFDGQVAQGTYGVKTAVQEFFGRRGLPITSTFLDAPWDSWVVVLSER